MLFMGLDIGSATSKCLIIDEKTNIRGKALASGGAGTEGPAQAHIAALKDASVSVDKISYTIATGYGRNLADCADGKLSELSCHAIGAYKLFPDARMVIDIGGQDAKILRLSEAGALESFVMNDKCAAGTGRFLEEISRVLNVEIGDMTDIAIQSDNKLDISSTCVVFAESEVISQLAQGASKSDVIGGIFRSVASRIGGLARRAGVAKEVVMTGGVAVNDGVRKALEDELDVNISASPLSQYAGALGAALYAQKQHTDNTTTE